MNTIFAPICPLGGSIVSVRFSGKNAFDILDVFAVSREVYSKKDLFFTKLFYNGKQFDEVVVKIFREPHSFTGENVVEIDLHGSNILLREFLKICSSIKNFKFATNGEFSRRAFLNGKMDLIKCEGLNALIRAETRRQYLLANTIFTGELSSKYKEIRKRLIEILTLIETNIDFSEEEVPQTTFEDLKLITNDLKTMVQETLKDKNAVDKILNGFSIAIIGSTNVGKSSLMNLIAKRNVAIVSPIAGTTRDVLSVDVNFDGYKATFYDTAGMRESEDIIEQDGVARAKKLAKDADLCLIVFDQIEDFVDKKRDFEEIYKNVIFVLNKSDLFEYNKDIQNMSDAVIISVKEKKNIEFLLRKIEENLISSIDENRSPLFANERHYILLEDCLNVLENIDFISMPIEIIGEEMRLVCDKIGKIVGDVYTEDVLDNIFSKFCIGK